FGLQLNVAKTEFMATNPPDWLAADASVAVDGTPLTRCTAFRFLGSYLTSDGCSAVDVDSSLCCLDQVAIGDWCALRQIDADEAEVQSVPLNGTSCRPLRG